MHPVFQNVERKVLVKSLVVYKKLLISESVCIMEQVNFLGRVQKIFRENRKLHNCSIINHKEDASKDTIYTKVN